MEKKISFKIGGSLLYLDDLKINQAVLEKVKRWFEKYSSQYDKIVMFVGGGKLTRTIGGNADDYIDNETSIHALSMQLNIANAELVKGFVGDSSIYVARSFGYFVDALHDDSKRIVFGGGLKPGWSSDMDTAVAADMLSLDRCYKISDIDHIYTADPRKDPNARPIKAMSWEEYFHQFDVVVGQSSHKSNENIPIDVTCAQFCYQKGIKFFVSGGKTLDGADDIAEVFESGSRIG